jgi:hypothetical protein
MSTKSTPKDPKTRSYLEPQAFDRRVRDRNLATGAIDQKGLDKYLGELVDVADKADTVTVHQPGANGANGANGAS